MSIVGIELQQQTEPDFVRSAALASTTDIIVRLVKMAVLRLFPSAVNLVRCTRSRNFEVYVLMM